MLIIAVIGLVVNVVVALILGGHEHEEGKDHGHAHEEPHGQKETSVRKDLNLNSAFLHVLGDAISSVGVIVAAILIKITSLSWIDPLVSILIGFVIISSSYRVLRGALRILVEGVPEGLSIKEISQTILDIPGIVSVHDLHVWSICSGAIALSAHVVLDQQSAADRMVEMQQVKEVLARQYQIEHTTIQFEDCPCMSGQGGCN
jgi:cobalt-zinc-cadmium efflux system protein